MSDISAVRAFIAGFDGRGGISNAEGELLEAVLDKFTGQDGRVDYEGALANLQELHRVWSQFQTKIQSKTMTEMAAAIRSQTFKAPATDKPVPIQVYWDDPLQPSVTVTLSPNAFHWRNGQPVGLRGPRVAVRIYESEQHQIEAIKPDANGGFLTSRESTALGQTTAFFAANQVLELAERSAGRPITWGGNGRLELNVYNYVFQDGTEPNGISDPAFGEIRLSAWADVVDGQLSQYSGRLFDELDDEIDALRKTLTTLSSQNGSSQLLMAARAKLKRLESYRSLGMRKDVGVEEFEKKATAILERARSTIPTEDYEAESATIGWMNYMVDVFNPVENERMDLAMSREFVAHEVGHSALNALKPSLMGTVVGRSVNEAYADLMAFYTAWDRPESADALIAQTQGDLTKPSSATRIAEDYARSRARATRDTGDDRDRELRNIGNSTRARDLPGLKLNAREFKVEGGDPKYEVALLLSGTNHEIFGRLANARLAKLLSQASPEQRRRAVLSARDDAAALLHRMLVFLPEDGGTLNDLVAANFKADKYYFDGKLRNLLEATFRKRGLLNEAAPPFRPGANLPALRLSPSDTQGILERTLAMDNYKSLIAKMAPSTAGELVLDGDVTDDRGIRVLRFKWVATGERTRDMPLLGPYYAESQRSWASLVFAPTGDLIAMHPVDSSPPAGN